MLLAFCLAGSYALHAQSDSLSSRPYSKELQIQVNKQGLDEEINARFAPIGTAIGKFIFYAPKLGEDVVVSMTGKEEPGKDFYEEPPFKVIYESGSVVPIRKLFTLSPGDSAGLYVSYEQNKRLVLGKDTLLDGKAIQCNILPESYDPVKKTLRLEVRGDSALIEAVRFEALELPKNALPTSLQSIGLTFPVKKAIQEGETIEADGFKFRIERNPNSAYKMSSISGYTFLIDRIMFLPIIVCILIGGAVFFTLYFRFVNLRLFGLSLDVVQGKYSNPKDAGEVSHFQALSAALSGTVGLGNIAGVAIAISLGGAGATFWMIMAGILGMSSKFTECTLAVRYRKINERGIVSGGPMYYLSEGFANKGFAGLGKIFAIVFSIACVGAAIGAGNMFQVNQAYLQFQYVTGESESFITGYAWLFGLAMAILTALVIIGGIKSIANVTDKLVPLMCGVYVLAGIVILIMNFGEIPRAFSEIMGGAFNPKAVAGGVLGAMIQGFRRGAFSNEAGVGSAPIAHAAVRTKYPASEGIVALLEPFIDTVIVCTTTAIVIVITNNHHNPNPSDGVKITSMAFSSELPFFKYILSLSVMLFAFSTLISWSYYGLKSWTYLFGESRISDTLYKLFFCLFIIIGSASSLNSVMDFGDAMIFAMAFPNIIGLFLLAPEVKTELARYVGKIRSGEIPRRK